MTPIEEMIKHYQNMARIHYQMYEANVLEGYIYTAEKDLFMANSYAKTARSMLLKLINGGSDGR